MHQLLKFLRNKKKEGLSLVETIISLTVLSMIAVGIITTIPPMLHTYAEARQDLPIRLTAENEYNRNVVMQSYENVVSIPRSTINPINKLDSEIAVKDNGDGSKTATIHIYKTGSSTPSFTFDILKAQSTAPVSHGSKIFTSSDTFIVPNGINSVTVWVIGSGGGGAGAKASGVLQQPQAEQMVAE